MKDTGKVFKSVRLPQQDNNSSLFTNGETEQLRPGINKLWPDTCFCMVCEVGKVLHFFKWLKKPNKIFYAHKHSIKFKFQGP